MPCTSHFSFLLLLGFFEALFCLWFVGILSVFSNVLLLTSAVTGYLHSNWPPLAKFILLRVLRKTHIVCVWFLWRLHRWETYCQKMSFWFSLYGHHECLTNNSLFWVKQEYQPQTGTYWMRCWSSREQLGNDVFYLEFMFNVNSWEAWPARYRKGFYHVRFFGLFFFGLKQQKVM